MGDCCRQGSEGSRDSNVCLQPPLERGSRQQGPVLPDELPIVVHVVEHRLALPGDLEDDREGHASGHLRRLRSRKDTEVGEPERAQMVDGLGRIWGCIPPSARRTSLGRCGRPSRSCVSTSSATLLRMRNAAGSLSSLIPALPSGFLKVTARSEPPVCDGRNESEVRTDRTIARSPRGEERAASDRKELG